MSQQEDIDHGANIAQMIGRRDDQIRVLNENLQAALGDKSDLEKEVASLNQDALSLRLKIRRQARGHAAEIALRDERIREITGYCNEETQEKTKLRIELDSVKQKSAPAIALPFILQLIVNAGVAHYHAVIAQCSIATVNKATNKVARELREIYDNDNVVKHPSLYRAAARLCNQLGVELPSAQELHAQLKKYVVDNIDLYTKDPQYSVSKSALRQIVAARNNAAHYGAYGRDVYRMFDWLPAITADHDDVEDEYNDLVEQSVYQICRNLISDSFS